LNQIGQELLAYELPAKLRLIGLRVTNLKDLRAPESGIKKVRLCVVLLDHVLMPAQQFFGQIEPGEDRPSKRRKLDTVAKEKAEPIVIKDEEEDDILLEDRRDRKTAHPASQKRAASVSPERQHVQQNKEKVLAPRASSHEPQASQDFMLSTASKPNPKKKAQEDQNQSSRSENVETPTTATGVRSKKTNVPSSEQHVCPICSKTLQTDNAGLNAHIDWCLSRTAILEASASSEQPKENPKPKSGRKDSKSKDSKPTSSKSVKGDRGDIRSAWKRL
jgi:DNA polymerase kappa